MSVASPVPRACGPGQRPGRTSRGAGPGALLLLVFAFVLCACSSLGDACPDQFPCAVDAGRWPQAEESFRHDKHWLGGDGAYSVVLGQDRVLWLFGDSFIGDGVSRDRHRALVVRNTVAVQEGGSPAGAPVRFFWKTRDGRPEAFFPGQGVNWYWPGSGALVRGRLLVFLMEIAPVRGGLGFEPRGWSAQLVANPEDEPGEWITRRLAVPENPFRIIVGSACCVVEGDYLYAFGAHARSHSAYAVRWRLSDAAQGNLKTPEWWAGKDGWVPQDRLAGLPEPLFKDGQMEFTVHWEPSLGGYVEVQTGSFTDHCLMLRWSRNLSGPWSEKRSFYCPRDTGGLLVYAGKAHPGLAGGDLVCTLAVNSLDEKRLLDDDSLYYPVFVRGTYRGCGKRAR